MEQLGSHWTDFHEFLCLNIFRKSIEKIQLSLKPHKNNGYIRRKPVYIFSSSSENDTCFKQNFMFNIFFPLKSCRLWDNVGKYGRTRQATDDNIIRRMRFAYWITKATDTHFEHVILTAFRRQKWLRERATMLLLYVHCLFCLIQYLLGVCARKLSCCNHQ